MKTIAKGGVLLSSAALLVLTGGLAVAQKSIESTNVEGQPYPVSSKKFAQKAAEGGLLEVQLGQLAQQKATNDQVKQFGQRMVTDHMKLNDDLMSVASKDKLTLPTTLTAKDKAEYDKLSSLSGTAFDRAYMKDMVRDHEKDVSEFQREANNGAHPDMMNFASSNLAMLQEHLMLARNTESSLGATSHR